ncbi:Flp family type IVb pilin [Burkholderia metallica]|uniref:Flp family type IVb pilin n=1 Tax=Burkholderia metallica TaxID=488729 RepID=A0ABT8PEL0_9BURK|nr:Flp family type IVb pilin [Burkholderia metallica]MDN7933566.1 Flp family type IVb pilin [Burkholderia metallica]VWB55132.1 pilus assembly protein [Burkholderia metallica]
MKAIIKRFLKENDGVTAIEYGLIAGLIAVAIVAGVTNIGSSLGNMFTNLGTCVSTPSATNCSAAAIRAAAANGG